MAGIFTASAELMSPVRIKFLLFIFMEKVYHHRIPGRYASKVTKKIETRRPLFQIYDGVELYYLLPLALVEFALLLDELVVARLSVLLDVVVAVLCLEELAAGVDELLRAVLVARVLLELLLVGVLVLTGDERLLGLVVAAGVLDALRVVIDAAAGVLVRLVVVAGAVVLLDETPVPLVAGFAVLFLDVVAVVPVLRVDVVAGRAVVVVLLLLAVAVVLRVFAPVVAVRVAVVVPRVAVLLVAFALVLLLAVALLLVPVAVVAAFLEDSVRDVALVALARVVVVASRFALTVVASTTRLGRASVLVLPLIVGRCRLTALSLTVVLPGVLLCAICLTGTFLPVTRCTSLWRGPLTYVWLLYTYVLFMIVVRL